MGSSQMTMPFDAMRKLGLEDRIHLPDKAGSL